MLWLDSKRKNHPTELHPRLKVSEMPNITHGGGDSKASPLLSVHSWTHGGQKSEPFVSLPHAQSFSRTGYSEVTGTEAGLPLFVQAETLLQGRNPPLPPLTLHNPSSKSKHGRLQAGMRA